MEPNLHLVYSRSTAVIGHLWGTLLPQPLLFVFHLYWAISVYFALWLWGKSTALDNLPLAEHSWLKWTSLESWPAWLTMTSVMVQSDGRVLS